MSACPYSVLLLTHNEAANIGPCIEALVPGTEVVVVDSGSTDGTQAIAEKLGARVVHRPFDNFAGQRNFGLDSVVYANAWILHLDADERLTPECHAACVEAIRRDEHSGYFIPNRIFFMGRWIKRTSQYPCPQLRLTKLGECRFESRGHGQYQGPSKRAYGWITAPYDHYNFSKGLAEWFEKHNRYSSAEAQAAVASRSGRPPAFPRLFRGSRAERRAALKELAAGLPCRGAWKFGYLYLARLGFLDGLPGLQYCVMQAIYETMIELKIKELERRQKGLVI